VTPLESVFGAGFSPVYKCLAGGLTEVCLHATVMKLQIIISNLSTILELLLKIPNHTYILQELSSFHQIFQYSRPFFLFPEVMFTEVSLRKREKS